MSIDLRKLKKTQSSSLPPQNAMPPDTAILATVRVRVANYVPKCVTVRAKIDEHFFTATMTYETLQALESDPNVASCELNQCLRGGADVAS